MKKSFVNITLILSFCLGTSLSANSNKTPETGITEKVSKISFTENTGQIHDQNNLARPDVLFTGTDGELTFHLMRNGISYQLSRIDSWKKEDNLSKYKNNFEENELENIPDQITIYRLDINWLNVNTNALIKKGKASAGYNNYYLQNCPNGALEVKNFEDVVYQNIYKGVDLKWYQKDGHLK